MIISVILHMGKMRDRAVKCLGKIKQQVTEPPSEPRQAACSLGSSPLSYATFLKGRQLRELRIEPGPPT